MSLGRGSMAVLASILAAFATLATGCADGLPFVSGDDAEYLDAGQALIEGDIGDRIGLGALEATCRGRGLSPGDAFACTAMSPSSDPIEFVGTISDDGNQIDLVTTNLLLADRVEEIEVFAASLIASETGRAATAENFECANSSIVVSPGETIACLFTDPGNGTIFDVSVTIEDLDDLSIAVAVGEPIG